MRIDFSNGCFTLDRIPRILAFYILDTPMNGDVKQRNAYIYKEPDPGEKV